MVIIPDKLWQQVKEFERETRRTCVAMCNHAREKYHRVNQWVFVSRNDNQMERSVVHRMIKRACKRAGVDERASAHWLRHILTPVIAWKLDVILA